MALSFQFAYLPLHPTGITMTFPQAIKSAFKNFAKFDGRATRSEYWWFALFQLLVLAVPYMMMAGETSRGGLSLGGLLYFVIAVGFFLPALGLAFRRLHDTNRSAWWLLISFVPLVGGIVLLVFMCLPGTPGPNRYGAGNLVQNVANTFS
jgi:uncharacterized membrane protein YhaH (DUF805 family)